MKHVHANQCPMPASCITATCSTGIYIALTIPYPWAESRDSMQHLPHCPVSPVCKRLPGETFYTHGNPGSCIDNTVHDKNYGFLPKHPRHLHHEYHQRHGPLSPSTSKPRIAQARWSVSSGVGHFLEL